MVRLNNVSVYLRICVFMVLIALISSLTVGVVLSSTGDRRLWMVVGFVVLFSLLASIPLIRSFTVPLNKLKEGMDALSSGRGELIPEVHEQDIIGDVLKTFNRVVQVVEKAIRGKDMQVEHVKATVHKTERNAAELSVLYDLAHKVMGVHALGELFSEGLSHVVDIVEVEWAYAMRYDHETEEYVMEKVVGFKPEVGAEIKKIFNVKNRFPADRTIAEIVRHEGVPLLSHKEARELKFKDYDEFSDLKSLVKTFCCVPIGQGEQFVGVLGYVNKRGDSKFTRADQDFMIQLASLVEAGYRRIRMFENGFVDNETGLFRSEYFRQRLVEEMAFSRRYNTPMALVEAAIDKPSESLRSVKKITRQVGSLLKNHLRVIDVMTSPSPGRFWVIFSDTDPEGAIIGAGRIKEKIERSVFGPDGNPLAQTISCGVTPYRAQPATAEALLKTASQVLDEARSKGGNRVACADVIVEDDTGATEKMMAS